MNIRMSITLICTLFCFSCIGLTQNGDRVDIVPMPNQIVIGETFHKVSGFEYDTEDTMLVNILADYTNRIKMPIDGDGKIVYISIEDTISKAEAYRLLINDTTSILYGSDYAGVMYGLGALEQMMSSKLSVPSVDIYDYPRFQWRGFMIDVSRHFFDRDKIFDLIDILSYHRINKLHLHLTDGIGWRLEIARYPLLTGRGAWRVDAYPEAPWGATTRLSTKEDSLAKGGYYTKEDITQIVKYAQAHNIEVIPEIEMPGHSDAILEIYPQYGCSSFSQELLNDTNDDMNNDTAEQVSNSGVFCVGKDTTYTFLTNILSEVIDMFPSKYIHIGADEVPMKHWDSCEDCKDLIKREGLANSRELYGYFISRIASYLKQNGKELIGWDEITDNELPDNVTVMSWTGWQGGLKAAKDGHKVIMTPLDYMYFDHYQSISTKEPQAWGGNNTLSRVYDFPVVPNKTVDSVARNIIGGQANLWTENISEWSHFQYMLLPRLSALSEALWSMPENKNWHSFQRRVLNQMLRYDRFNWNYSKSALIPTIKQQFFDENRKLHIEFDTEIYDGVTLRYTLDGTVPTLNSAILNMELMLDSASNVVVASFLDSTFIETLEIPRLMNKATKGKMRYYSTFNPQYQGGGDRALIDNLYAGKRGDDSRWQGFERKDARFSVDLGEPKYISEITIRFFQHLGSTSVMLPTSVDLSISSDEKKWQHLASKEVGQIENYNAHIVTEIFKVDTTTQYILFEARNRDTLPDWHLRKGQNAWVFIDEITVN